MSDELSREISALKDRLSFLSERVQQLERRAGLQAPAPATARVAPPPPKPLSPTPQPARAPSKDALETTIGRYWLNRIGIGSLVLGIVFFILYSFQYLGPVAKLLIGFAVGGSLLGTGTWLDRRRGWGWYARGLIGGGWAIVYFTTYAMHHVPAVRILPSALVDLLLLVAVTAGAVRHALAYRSPVITAFAFMLGFITTSISSITFFTLASSACLVIALVTVAVRMKWHGLCLYGVLASYLTHVWWIQPQMAVSPMFAFPWATMAQTQFWLTAGFLSLYWAAYTVAILALDEEQAKGRTMTALLVNALMFVTQMDTALRSAYDARYLLLAGVGAAYLALSRMATIRKLPALSTAQLLIGLTLITLAIPDRLSDRWTSALWTIEVASLAWLGLRYDRWAYRLFAAFLGVAVLGRFLFHDARLTDPVQLAGFDIPWRLFIGGVSAAVFSAAAAVYRRLEFRNRLRSLESQAFHLYAAAAAVMVWNLTWLEGSRAWIACLWSAEAAAVVWLGWRLKDRGLRMQGIAWLGLAAYLALTDLIIQPAGWSLAAACGVAGLLYGIGLLYRADPPGECFAIEEHLTSACIAAASLVLTGALWREVPSRWLSLAWAGEGFALVALGFALREKAFRYSGLAVFAALVLKILLVDLAAAETIYRILSFIVAGLVLMAASLAYAKYAGRQRSGE